MTIRFDGQVAVVTGAGQGLGRAHALALAARGAKVVVNDVGGALDGSGTSAAPGGAVVAEIEAAGGEAMASPADVTSFEEVQAMIEAAKARWGRIDILVNNAGILRDKSFAKLDLADFRKVIDVHLIGTVNCTKACWDIMRDQEYGRIVVTTSSAGLFGNFGQTAYSAAKLGVVGFMNTLAQEGRKSNICVNALAPAAATRMTQSVLTEEQNRLLTPESVAIGMCFLVSADAPTRTILAAGAGSFAITKIVETQGYWLSEDTLSPEGIAANWERIIDPAGEIQPMRVEEQTGKFLDQAAAGIVA